MSKNVMSGGYNEQEARNLLLIRGIEHVKGIIPHNVPKNANLAEFDDLPTISVEQIWNSFAQRKPHRNVRLYQMRLKFDEPVCQNCCDALELWSQKDIMSYDGYRLIQFSHNWNDEICVLCGGICDDFIPF